MYVRLEQDLELSLAPGLKPEPLAAGLEIDLPRATAERLVRSRVARVVPRPVAVAGVAEPAETEAPKRRNTRRNGG